MKKHKSSVDYYLKHENKKKPSGKVRKKLRRIINVFLVIFSAAVLGFAFSMFIMQSVHMEGPSMQPQINDGDVLLLNKAAYMFSDVKRYDIVAIQRMKSKEYFDIKRVVGLPGDELSCVGGYLIINGRQARIGDEPITITTAGRLDGSGIKLGDEEYFVLGDNTNYSLDSRFVNYGNIQKSEIKGKVFYRIKPGDQKGKLK